MNATITRNPNLLLIARQFIWMEMFTQRVYARPGLHPLQRLEPGDRAISIAGEGMTDDFSYLIYISTHMTCYN